MELHPAEREDTRVDDNINSSGSSNAEVGESSNDSNTSDTEVTSFVVTKNYYDLNHDFLKVDIAEILVYPQQAADGFFACVLMKGISLSLCESISLDGHMHKRPLEQGEMLSDDLVEVCIRMEGETDFQREDFTDKEVVLEYLLQGTVSRRIKPETVEVSRGCKVFLVCMSRIILAWKCYFFLFLTHMLQSRVRESYTGYLSTANMSTRSLVESAFLFCLSSFEVRFNNDIICLWVSG